MALNLKPADFIPRFVMGEDADLAEWLVHLHHPRFACRVRDEEWTEAEREAAPEFFMYEFGGEAFSDFVWHDPQPSDDGDLEALLSAAADFVESITR